MNTDADLIDRYRRAQLFFEARDYGEAARLARELVDAEPGRLDLRILLARALYHSAQLNRAEAELRHIVDRYPDESYARLMLGRTLERLGRASEATAHLRLAAALSGEPVDAPRRLASQDGAG
ncbi:tetratricopeptide repeat protein [Streptomyces bohaiensis]|uniref:Tetratricopeptide repeat protein n=1 Tax=Streptomyces bohaiensis TaxID=1431344 RepID=A0ABX1CJ85_9ACTN|nr:tetratricopeptide repeat protein [Streptomyces bohaiensis]NJQ17517.1 tetratricopeptide repeat protein [Streptomyces bohaiensis]